MKLDVINLDNKSVGSVEVADEVFAAPVRNDIISRVIHWQLAKRRAGTHLVKSRSDVSGTTKKPFKQKGTGRARQGSLRGTQFRGGGIIFGPVLRDHGYSLPKKIRALGLRSALSAKAKEGKLIIVDDLSASKAKTKDMKAKLDKLGWKSALLVGGAEVNQDFALSVRNIIGFDVLPQQGINVYDILKKDTLVLTKDAVQHLEARLK